MDSRPGGKGRSLNVATKLFKKDSQIYFIVSNTKYKKCAFFLWCEMFAIKSGPLSLKRLRITDFEYCIGM